MKISLVVVLIFSFLTSTFASNDDTKIKIALGAMFASSQADLITTCQAIDRGAIELNPVLGQNKSQIVVTKEVMTGLTMLSMWELNKKKPKLAFWVTLGVAGIYAVLAVHNHNVAR